MHVEQQDIAVICRQLLDRIRQFAGIPVRGFAVRDVDEDGWETGRVRADPVLQDRLGFC